MEQQTNNFENLLKTKSEGYRMYPSDKVWNNINRQLHNKQGFASIMVSILLLLSLTTYLSYKPLENYTGITLQEQLLTLETLENSLYTNPTLESKKLNENINTHLQSSTPKLSQKEFIENITQSNFNNNKKTISKATSTPTTNKLIIVEDDATNFTSITIKPTSVVNNTIIEKIKKLTETEKEQNEIALESNTENIPLIENQSNDLENSIENIEINKMTQNSNKLNLETTTSNHNETFINPILKVKATAKKVKTEFYISPSISYRNLFDKRNTLSNSSVMVSNDLLSQSVIHKPAMGLEVGTNFILHSAYKIEFKAGVQLNYNKYTINAEKSSPELTNISLSGNNQTFTSVSTLRTEGSNKTQWLAHNSLQFSIPIGFNLNLIGKEKVQFGIASTLQPTLLLKSKMLLLSTNLKNYTEMPSLVRKLNLNGSIETFVSVKGKKAVWQMGPQVRYQFFSSYDKKYPFQENIFNYGFKIGVSNIFQ